MTKTKTKNSKTQAKNIWMIFFRKWKRISVEIAKKKILKQNKKLKCKNANFGTKLVKKEGKKKEKNGQTKYN